MSPDIQEKITKARNAGFNDQQIQTFLSSKGISATLPPPDTYLNRVTQSIGNDVNSRIDRMSSIMQRPTGTLEKGAQMFGQGAGLAAHSVETAVGEIPGVKQAFQAVGSGIGALSKSKPIAAIGNAIGSNPHVQEIVGLYDSDLNFKDTVDSVANIFRLGADVSVGGVASKATTGTVSKVKVPSIKMQTPALVKNVTKDVVPTLDRIVNHQVTRALDLTAGDVKNVHLSTGNEPAQFLAKNNLIGGNLKETSSQIDTFFKKNYADVRTEIGKVQTEYGAAAVPRYEEALKAIKQNIAETPGLQSENSAVDALLQKKTITLSDVQQAKELMDDHFSLYKATGDVREGVAKQGLANIRSDLQQFIEKQVGDTTGADIRALNNNVQTSRAITNAIEERSTRGLTRANIRIGDFGTFGVATMAFGGNPAMGFAAVIAKRIVESPTFGLRLSRYLDSLSDAQRLKIKQQIQAGKVPPEIDELYASNASSKLSKSENPLSTQTTNNSGASQIQRSADIPGSIPQGAEKAIADHFTSAEQVLKEAPATKLPELAERTKINIADGLEAQGFPALANHVRNFAVQAYKTFQEFKDALMNHIKSLDFSDNRGFAKIPGRKPTAAMPGGQNYGKEAASFVKNEPSLGVLDTMSEYLKWFDGAKEAAQQGIPAAQFLKNTRDVLKNEAGLDTYSWSELKLARFANAVEEHITQLDNMYAPKVGSPMYRGENASNKGGVHWTFNKAEAQKFAGEKGNVLEGKVPADVVFDTDPNIQRLTLKAGNQGLTPEQLYTMFRNHGYYSIITTDSQTGLKVLLKLN